MEIVISVLKSMGTALLDAFSDMYQHSVTILAVLIVAFVLNLILPLWVIGVAIAILAATIGYVTYSDEIRDIEKNEEPD